MKSLRALPLVILVACSQQADPGDAGDSGPAADGTVVDASAADVPVSTDISAADAPALSDSAAADTAIRSDSSPSDAFDLSVSHPPPGATLCASGAINQTDARLACMAPSSILDSTFLPDGGRGMIARQCDAVTVAGGRWEAWCSSAGVYLWARFEGIRATGTWTSCASITHLSVGLGYADYAAGGHGGGGTVSPRSEPNYFFDRDMHSTNVILTQMLDGSFTSGGTGHFFVTAYHDILCSGSMPTPGRDADAVVAGISMRWPM